MSTQEIAQFKDVGNLMNQGRVEQTLLWIDDMLAREQLPQPVAVLLMWGKSNIFQRTEQPGKEIAVLEQLISLRPHQLFEHNLGRAYSKLGDNEDAEKHYLASLGMCGGNYPLARYNLGLLYCHVGRRRDAELQLEALKTAGADVPQELVSGLQTMIRKMR